MEAKVKQRVIGGLVLAAVVAIFLPLLFYRSHPSMNLALSTDVPNAPAQPQVQLQLPPDPHADNSGENSTATNAQNAIDPDATTTTTAQNVQTAAEKTPKVTQKILNTQPVPAVTAQPVANTPATQAAAPPADGTPVAPESAQTTPQPPAAEPMSVNHSEEAVSPPPVVKPVGVHPQPKLTKVASSLNVVLQIASFANAANATRLVQQLRAKGIDAHINKQTAGISRVYVGPLSNRTMAMQLQQKLKQQWHLTSVIKNT